MLLLSTPNMFSWKNKKTSNTFCFKTVPALSGAMKMKVFKILDKYGKKIRCLSMEMPMQIKFFLSFFISINLHEQNYLKNRFLYVQDQ